MTTQWKESLNDSELTYLQNRYAQELKKFLKAYKGGLIIAVITSALICLILFILYLTIPVLYKKEIELKYMEPMTLDIVFLYSLVSWIAISMVLSAAFACAYLLQMYGLRKDIKDKTKIIEITTILEKKHMPHNDSYHFVIKSRNKYTIEVDQETFSFFNEGDEINLEYSQNAKIDLGYY